MPASAVRLDGISRDKIGSTAFVLTQVHRTDIKGLPVSNYLDDPNDPDVQRRSKLLGMSVLKKMQEEALAQAAHDPEQFEKLQRYFAGLQLRGEP